VGALPQEIIWTSGATESNNLALHGVAEGYRKRHPTRSGHIVTNVIEHKSVLEPVRSLEQAGFAVTYVQPDVHGAITAEAIATALTSDTFLVSVMWANNELGTVNEIEEIGRLCRQRRIIFHCDGTQWTGKMPAAGMSSFIDLMSWSSHKIYGPKGVGALYIRSSAIPFRMEPLLRGGGQENGLRSGTLNVPGVVGFGMACAIAREKMAQDAERLGPMRDQIESAVLAHVPGARINGRGAKRLPHISSMTFVVPSLKGNLLEKLPGIECSAGAACGSRNITPSHVLRALSIRTELTRSTIRLSLGRPTTDDEVDRAIGEILQATANGA
jgi:cysteine desulfurase